MIYLDNAATTFPKPRAVAEAVLGCMQDKGGNPGRGGHQLSLAAGKTVYACREAVGALFGASVEQVVFAQNATHALNLAIKGLARRGGHVLISDLEHNAVRRPVAALREEGGSYGVFPTGDGDPTQIRKELLRRLRRDTSLVVCTHASNICSVRLPIEEIGALCRERGIRFVVDASQSAGSADISIDRTCADAVCAPGHKGLYGPQGCGFAVFAKQYLGERGRMLRTCMQGGSGIESLPEGMPQFLPERMEAGTLPTPAIAGLIEGIQIVQKLGSARILQYETTLFLRMREQLDEMSRVRIYRPEVPGAVLLFSMKGLASEEVADRLDRAGICVRAGFHCAPLAHRTLQTPEDGAVRVSFSVYNTADEVDRVCAVLREMR